MKKATLAFTIFSFALTVAGAPRSESNEHRLGRRDDDQPSVSVPDNNSTLELAAIGVAALGIAALAGKRKGSGSISGPGS